MADKVTVTDASNGSVFEVDMNTIRLVEPYTSQSNAQSKMWLMHPTNELYVVRETPDAIFEQMGEDDG